MSLDDPPQTPSQRQKHSHTLQVMVVTLGMNVDAGYPILLAGGGDSCIPRLQLDPRSQ